ncbi:MAG: hypothetical protein K2X25_01775 [Caulobacteraceae bacterium]|nr:hypothetical protein [Caulobacteraceae bacterium]
MTEGVRPPGPIDPVGPVAGRDRREAQRRDSERRARSTSRALVPVGEVVDEMPDPATSAASGAPLDPGAMFAAHMMGQTGQRKGLKGGPPVLDAARASYLGTEYSGEKDRRPGAGLIRKTEL